MARCRYICNQTRTIERKTLRVLIILIFWGILINSASSAAQLVSYRIDASVDYDLLTLKGSAAVTIPNDAHETLKDAVFYLYANSSGIVSDDRRKHIVVDEVWLGQEMMPFSLDGAMLRVTLSKPQNHSFTLRIAYHGIVPRSAGSESGQLFAALGSMLSDATQDASSGNSDYGLYCYSDGILSLGSFWYPQLAVRENGRWIDEVPQGLGDVTYSEASDFDVGLTISANVKVVTSGTASKAGRYIALKVRDFAILMSEDYTCKSNTVPISGRSVKVEACATQKNAAQIDSTLEAASQALTIFSNRFGGYAYDDFKVVEGTLRGGAGGMEFSKMTAIAPMLLTDWNAQLNNLSGLLGNLGGLDRLSAVLNPRHQAESGMEQTPKPPAIGIGNTFGSMLGPQGLLDSLKEMTIAHEVAHQWWAIAVGSDSIRNPFVDESLTNYSTMIYFEDRYGKETAGKMIDMHLKTPYTLARMLGLADAPANLPTSAYRSNVQYSAIVYGKGALYYDSLRRAIEDEAFFSALRTYYNEYRSRQAGPRSLLEIFAKEAPSGGTEALYSRWIEEKHGDQDISKGEIFGISDIFDKLLKNANPENQ
jgi:hypothetical protein